MNILFLMQKMHLAKSELERVSVTKEIENEFSTLSDEEKGVVRKHFLTGLHKKINEGKELIYHVDEYIEMEQFAIR